MDSRAGIRVNLSRSSLYKFHAKIGRQEPFRCCIAWFCHDIRHHATRQVIGKLKHYSIRQQHPQLYLQLPGVSGVLKGKVLGPLMFLLHIKDLPLSVHSQVRLFAYDCLLQWAIRSTEDQDHLQHDLQQLEQVGSQVRYACQRIQMWSHAYEVSTNWTESHVLT